MSKRNFIIFTSMSLLISILILVIISKCVDINELKNSHEDIVSEYESTLLEYESTLVEYECTVPDYRREINNLRTMNESLLDEIDLLAGLVKSYDEENQELLTSLEELNNSMLEDDNILNYKGEFLVTAYCSCSICCGSYADNRPVVNYKELVFTGAGYIAEQGITVAVDPSVIPIGTKIYIDGVGVRVAQDTGGLIQGNRLDVYYNNHDDAWNSGLNDRLRSVYIIQE